MPNCPICGRHLGTYTNDPLLTNPSLSTEEFKGFIQLITTHIEELQVERHQQEIDSGVTPLTNFTPISILYFYQNIKQYILELRDSTEKILAVTGMTLSEFLSTDEDGNPMTLKDNWSDSNLEEIKYQCKAIHIEDLRHYIQTCRWFERFNITPVGTHFSDSQYYMFGGAYNLNNYYPFSGDRGLWIINRQLTSYGYPSNYYSFNASSQNIDDGSGISTKLLLHSDISVTNDGSPIIVVLQVSASIPEIVYLFLNINPTTIISFNASTIADPGVGITNDSFVYFTIFFVGLWQTLTYIYGHSVASFAFNLSQSEFNNFNRNIYDDYSSIYGTPSYPLTIDDIQVGAFSGVTNYGAGTKNITSELIIDNIKIR